LTGKCFPLTGKCFRWPTFLMANKHRKVWKIVFWKLLFGNKYGLELNSIPKVPKNLRQITTLQG
jgi:hypothetical protein